MLETNVTREMYQEWLENHVTKSFFRAIHEQREVFKEELAIGRHEGKEQQVIFACIALNNILNTDFQEANND